MNQHDPNTLSFIIRIWREEEAPETGHVIWRGHVTHVPSGKRSYFQDMDTVRIFMESYLQEIGVDVKMKRSFFQKLKDLFAKIGRRNYQI